MIRKQQREERERTKLEKRVEKIPSAELTSWAEQAMFGIGRSLSTWARSNDRASLDEAVQGAEALAVVMRELQARYPL